MQFWLCWRESCPERTWTFPRHSYFIPLFSCKIKETKGKKGSNSHKSVVCTDALHMQKTKWLLQATQWCGIFLGRLLCQHWGGYWFLKKVKYKIQSTLFYVLSLKQPKQQSVHKLETTRKSVWIPLFLFQTVSSEPLSFLTRSLALSQHLLFMSPSMSVFLQMAKFFLWCAFNICRASLCLFHRSLPSFRNNWREIIWGILQHSSSTVYQFVVASRVHTGEAYSIDCYRLGRHHITQHDDRMILFFILFPAFSWEDTISLHVSSSSHFCGTTVDLTELHCSVVLSIWGFAHTLPASGLDRAQFSVCLVNRKILSCHSFTASFFFPRCSMNCILLLTQISVHLPHPPLVVLTLVSYSSLLSCTSNYRYKLIKTSIAIVK